MPLQQQASLMGLAQGVRGVEARDRNQRSKVGGLGGHQAKKGEMKKDGQGDVARYEEVSGMQKGGR